MSEREQISTQKGSLCPAGLAPAGASAWGCSAPPPPRLYLPAGPFSSSTSFSEKSWVQKEAPPMTSPLPPCRGGSCKGWGGLSVEGKDGEIQASPGAGTSCSRNVRRAENYNQQARSTCLLISQPFVLQKRMWQLDWIMAWFKITHSGAHSNPAGGERLTLGILSVSGIRRL